MNPLEEFLKHAADCEQMAKFTRDRESMATWNRMAERWRRCTEIFTSQNSAARHQMPATPHRHAVIVRAGIFLIQCALTARQCALTARRCSILNSSIRYCALRPAPQLPKYRQALALSESCPKIGDVPKSPFPSVAALVPSAGTITK